MGKPVTQRIDEGGRAEEFVDLNAVAVELQQDGHTHFAAPLTLIALSAFGGSGGTVAGALMAVARLSGICAATAVTR